MVRPINSDRLIVPTVNINGTHADNLVEALTDVAHVLLQAIEKMQAAMPHGRDYQVHGNGPQARKQWSNRISHVRNLRNEVIDLALSIQDQKLPL